MQKQQKCKQIKIKIIVSLLKYLLHEMNCPIKLPGNNALIIELQAL